MVPQLAHKAMRIVSLKIVDVTAIDSLLAGLKEQKEVLHRHVTRHLDTRLSNYPYYMQDALLRNCLDGVINQASAFLNEAKKQLEKEEVKKGEARVREEIHEKVTRASSKTFKSAVKNFQTHSGNGSQNIITYGKNNRKVQNRGSLIAETKILRPSKKIEFLRMASNEGVARSVPYIPSKGYPSVLIEDYDLNLKKSRFVGILLPEAYAPNSVSLFSKQGDEVVPDGYFFDSMSESFYAFFKNPLSGMYHARILASPNLVSKVRSPKHIPVSRKDSDRMIERLQSAGFGFLSPKNRRELKTLEDWKMLFEQKAKYIDDQQIDYRSYERREFLEDFLAPFRYLNEQEILHVNCSEMACLTDQVYYELSQGRWTTWVESSIRVPLNGGESYQRDRHESNAVYFDGHLHFLDATPSDGDSSETLHEKENKENKDSESSATRDFKEQYHNDGSQRLNSFVRWIYANLQDPQNPTHYGVLHAEEKIHKSFNDDDAIFKEVKAKYDAVVARASERYGFVLKPRERLKSLLESSSRHRDPQSGVLSDAQIKAQAMYRANATRTSPLRHELYLEDAEGNYPTSKRIFNSAKEIADSQQKDYVLRAITAQFAEDQIRAHVQMVADIFYSFPEKMGDNIPEFDDVFESLGFDTISKKGTLIDRFRIEAFMKSYVAIQMLIERYGNLYISSAEKIEGRMRPEDHFKFKYASEWFHQNLDEMLVLVSSEDSNRRETIEAMIRTKPSSYLSFGAKDFLRTAIPVEYGDDFWIRRDIDAVLRGKESLFYYFEKSVKLSLLRNVESVRCHDLLLNVLDNPTSNKAPWRNHAHWRIPEPYDVE